VKLFTLDKQFKLIYLNLFIKTYKINKLVMIIFYTGIGSNGKNFHSELDFLRIMEREFTYKLWGYEMWMVPEGELHPQLDFGDWILPDEFIFFTLEDWIKYSGAELIISKL
jgi:hypothetical protein